MAVDQYLPPPKYRLIEIIIKLEHHLFVKENYHLDIT